VLGVFILRHANSLRNLYESANAPSDGAFGKAET